MPYDTLVWAQSTQNNGLDGVAAKGPAPIQYSGDYNILRKGFGDPYITSLGGVSLTKPTGTAIVGNRSYGANKFCGPAGLYNPRATSLVIKYQEGEQLTGQLSNTNVSEVSIVHADCGYGGAHAHPANPGAALAMAGGGEMWCVPTSATAAAAVTPAYIGQLDGLTTDTNDQWLDTRASYHILGYVGCVGIAGDCGVITFTGLGGQWAGYVPGIPDKQITATFDTSHREGFDLCYEPIPFDGNGLPGYMATHLSNTAVLGGLLLAKHAAR